MQYRGYEIRPTPVIVGGVSTWESLAILTGLVPTVTFVVLKMPRPVRGILVLLITGWLLGHWEVFEILEWIRRWTSREQPSTAIVV